MWFFLTIKQKSLTLKKAYHDYLKVNLEDQDKLFTPKLAIKCVDNLKDQRNGNRKGIPFTILMVWREKKHYGLLYLHNKSKRNKLQNKHHVQYPDVLSTIRPIHCGPGLPVPEPDGNVEYSSDSEHSDMTDACKLEENDQPVLLTQAELYGQTQDVKHSKESAQLLGSCLKEKNVPGTTFYWYWDCERKIKSIFHVPG